MVNEHAMLSELMVGTRALGKRYSRLPGQGGVIAPPSLARGPLEGCHAATLFYSDNLILPSDHVLYCLLAFFHQNLLLIAVHTLSQPYRLHNRIQCPQEELQHAVEELWQLLEVEHREFERTQGTDKLLPTTANILKAPPNLSEPKLL